MTAKEREMLLYFANTCFGIISESKSPREAHCWTKHTYNMYEGSRGYYNQKHFGFRLLHRCLKSSSTVKKPKSNRSRRTLGWSFEGIRRLQTACLCGFPWSEVGTIYLDYMESHALVTDYLTIIPLEMTRVYQSLYSLYNSKKNGCWLRQDGCLCLRLWESIGTWNTVTGRGAGTCLQLLELDGPCLLLCTNNLEYRCQPFPTHSFICRRG